MLSSLDELSGQVGTPGAALFGAALFGSTLFGSTLFQLRRHLLS